MLITLFCVEELREKYGMLLVSPVTSVAPAL